MKKLLTSPVQMNLTDTQNQYYQQVLKYVAELSLNFMAVKVVTYPENFLDWCQEFHRICQEDLNLALLDDHQFKPLKKLEDTLVQAISVIQIKLSRVMPWPIFNAFIEQNATRHALQERLGLLAYLKRKLETPYSEWIEEDRLAFIGKHTAKHDPSVYTFDVEWFGATKGAKSFVKLFNEQSHDVCQLLELIPNNGPVSENQYFAFVEAYKALFTQHLPDEKIPFMPATRLLGMLRPDQFVVLTNAKLDSICQGLGVTKISQQVDRAFAEYWHEMIATIRQNTWWQQARPENETEIILWENRAILLDMFCYADENIASQSNYLKLLNKPTKTTSRSTTTKRTKASAEQLVDQALENDDTPDFVKGMRDSIIKSVQAGKSVTDAINLMKAIFS
ncbi:hypothetical protein [Thalassotalea eurytherma]|nr:hypothetical protein [Thalassotalea eurytherma]